VSLYDVQHIVNFSGGACSAWALRRVVDRYGTNGVVALFADVVMEDPDLYRFNEDVAKWVGVPITRISKEMTPWDLFEQEGMIGNSRSPICSVMLKREPLDEWGRENATEMTATLHLGIDWTEEHRLHAMRKAKPTWRIEAPMCEPPYWDKCKMLEELKAIGIEVPELYKLGFPHNNCGGFCVKAGQAQFAKLLQHKPERYRWHEEKEERLRSQVGDFSVMTDRRGNGKKKPLTMRDFRLRIEAGESFDRLDWGGCGCAIE
jgi:3'-phosphoadenosine 5'-phosphosulfate sulfotransferase (PAPS reductase)/FAD synthetase